MKDLTAAEGSTDRRLAGWLTSTREGIPGQADSTCLFTFATRIYTQKHAT